MYVYTHPALSALRYAAWAYCPCAAVRQRRRVYVWDTTEGAIVLRAM